MSATDQRTTYAGDRRILDCDAHIMEPPGWLGSFASTDVAAQLPVMDFGDPDFIATIERGPSNLERRRVDPGEAALAAAEYLTMPRRGWGALGDHDPTERRQVLDLLGFERQLVFPTGSFPQALLAPRDIRLDAIEAMNRGLAAFADVDSRLLAVGYVPMRDPESARRVLARAVADGVDTVMVDSVPHPKASSPTHPDFDPVWNDIVEHDLAVMLHVGLDNGHRPVPRNFFDNERDLPHFRTDAPGDALSYMAIGHGAEMFIAAMIFDGVLHRHPGLRFGVAELGATWVPGFQQFLDTSYRSFRRRQDLTHLDDVAPSEVLRRHFCFSPFAGENVGWMIRASHPDLFMFSSDYPHHEGSDDPIGRFERTMEGIGERDRSAFWAGNFERLLTGTP